MHSDNLLAYSAFEVMIIIGRDWYEEETGEIFWVYINPTVPGLLTVFPAFDYVYPMLFINPGDCLALT